MRGDSPVTLFVAKGRSWGMLRDLSIVSSVGNRKNKAPVFQPDEWRLVEEGFNSGTQAVSETLMAQAGGYLGTRGTFEEPVADGVHSIEGTYLNGVFLRQEIHYDEAAFGFASHNNKMVSVPDGKRFEILAGNEFLVHGESSLESQTRVLDMRDGLLSRTSRWTLRAGHTLEINSRRFVSMATPGLMVIEYSVASVDYEGPLVVRTGLGTNYGGRHEGFDPRAGALSVNACLEGASVSRNGDTTLLCHTIRGSSHTVHSGYRLAVEARAPFKTEIQDEHGFWGRGLSLAMTAGAEVRLTKYVAYTDGPKADQAAQQASLEAMLATADCRGFDGLYEDHKAHFDRFWQQANVQVVSADPVEQGIRFGAYHLYQSAGQDGRRALGAKGLTGPGYDGHCFWDTEIYAVPFFVFTQPAIARALLEYRISKLDEARARARQMGHDKGALFPWRTIGGEECSSYFPAGTAQYHINAAIAYALTQYVSATGDASLLRDGGAEMLFETARIWMGLGHFNDRKGGRFCIHEVTGPDEYTAMVDNNLYTNMLAQHHLREAAAVARGMAEAGLQAIMARIGLESSEVEAWQQAADAMYLPYSEAQGIHEQCDGFLDKPEWDFAGTPEEKYPLLLNYHPLVIYRHQVLKQPDVVLAQILLPDAFSAEEKARNLAYYEPRTTHDSTLSACMHAVAHAESGDRAKAYAFFEETYQMDLENRHANTHYGNHMACMAGSWMGMVYGFGGMRLARGELSFNPYLPEGWTSYSFSVACHGTVLRVAVSGGQVSFVNSGDADIRFRHGGNHVSLKGRDATTLPIL